ncbi:hypothetical protein BDR04DRAFT_1174299 [Suillus decipiens]|nr:hypothetical protein BDR04DRAFT_1174299 [Suillus decipiens]
MKNSVVHSTQYVMVSNHDSTACSSSNVGQVGEKHSWSLCAEGYIILIVRSSALCATAYKRGRTAHYLFGIPVMEDNVDLHSTIHPFSA